jgi:hypothetical protein
MGLIVSISLILVKIKVLTNVFGFLVGIAIGMISSFIIVQTFYKYKKAFGNVPSQIK